MPRRSPRELDARHDAGPALCRANVSAKPGLRADCGPDAGAGNWGEHGHIFRRSLGPPRTALLHASWTTSGIAANRSRAGRLSADGGRLPRLARAKPDLARHEALRCAQRPQATPTARPRAGRVY